MSTVTTVGFCRGIDYGTRDKGNVTAWAWWDDPVSYPMDKRVGVATANGGYDRPAHLVVYSKESFVTLWDVDNDDPCDAVVDVEKWMREGVNVAREDERLWEFCKACHLPRLTPRWLVVTDQS